MLSAWITFAPSSVPYSIAFTRQAENCLPGRVALLEKVIPTEIHEGDFVLFRPFSLIANITEPWVSKVVKGMPGDHLEISDGIIKINGFMQDGTLLAAPLFQKKIVDYDVDEIIPPGKYFVMGSHPFSIDSRYWGYLDRSQILGKAHIII
jgi:conjugal transfer pilin signal peptidase TrbI